MDKSKKKENVSFADVYKVGVTSYSNNGRLEWALDGAQTANNDILYDSIQAIQHIAGTTNTPDGLQLTRTQVFNADGDR